MTAALLIAAVLSAASGPASDLSDADSLAVSPSNAIEKVSVKDRDNESGDHNLFERFAGAVGTQLSGECRYSPQCHEFFGDAMREAGPLRAMVFTADRITRSGRIGTMGRSFLPSDDGLRHEGVEAYMPRLREKTLAVTPTVEVSHGVAGGASIGNDYDFALYLLGSGLYKDASTLLSRSWAPSDTLDFLRGRLAFDKRRLGEAAAYFGGIDSDSPFYEHALFHSVVADAHLGRYDEASDLLDGYRGQYQELAELQRAGLALLRSDPSAFRAASASFSHSSYAFSESEAMLESVYRARFESRSKSPALAALMSAVVPGSGKIYAGKTGEGIASFLYVGTFAAMTAENWVKAGPKDWKTLLFGLTGTLFYIGNIYGSYVSVSIYNDDFRNVQDTAVLYHIHIPLRSVFN